MSTAPGKLIIQASNRLPLEEGKIGTSVTLSNPGSGSSLKLVETPITYKNSYDAKITTPPESVLFSRKNNVLIETPIPKHSDSSNEAVNDVTMSVLLSPAFSSPQSTKEQIKRILEAPAKPSFLTAASSSSSFSEDENVVKSVKKKTKRSKREIKEQSFNLDSYDKPPYSYATLIGMSILSNEEKKLTLSQIYQWISDTFKYYKRDEMGWQNSIRHNLSLNKAFVKGEKSKDGKGHFWCIKSGCEEQFLKARSNKNNSYQEIMDQIYSSVKSGKYQKRSINSIPSSPNISNDIDEENDPENDKEGSYSLRKRKSLEIEEAADYNNDDEDEDDLTHSVLDPPTKKQKLLSASTGDGNLISIPNLGAPFSQWQATPNGFKNKNVAIPLMNNTPKFMLNDTPNKPFLAGKNLTYTSSFSCNSNLELSPIRPSETGPLLEPLTPANNIYNPSHNAQQVQQSHHQSQQIQTQQRSTLMSNHYSHNYNHHHHFLQKTPKSNILRTPLRNLKTPQTNSIMKKLWNSPSYLEEFYYSPLMSSSATLLNSYDDDDMIMRNLEQQHSQNYLSKKQQVFESSRNLINDFKKLDNALGSSGINERNHNRKISSSSTELDE